MKGGTIMMATDMQCNKHDLEPPNMFSNSVATAYREDTHHQHRATPLPLPFLLRAYISFCVVCV
jgi:hypothetical protein